MKKAFITLIFTIVFISCNLSDPVQEQSTAIIDEAQVVSKVFLSYDIPPNHIYYLQQLGFSGSTVQVVENFDQTTNETYISYLLENDIEIRAEEIFKHLPPKTDVSDNNLTNQYRTSIIANPDVYTVAIYSFPLLNGDNYTGIQNAINNYNNLNLGISFNLVAATNSGARRNCNNNPNCIKVLSGSIAGGQAGFPYNNGKPYKNIVLNTFLGQDYGADVVEHVMSHELGHCIGLRHTDWFDRQCISTPGNEGQGQYGAIHIPGTPAMVNIDFNSIMMACFDGSETGEFTNHDITALETLW